MRKRLNKNEARYVWDMNDVFTLGELGTGAAWKCTPRASSHI
jgi:hypothetical protein